MRKRARDEPNLVEVRPATRVMALEAALDFVRDTSEVAARVRADSNDERWLPERVDDDPVLVEAFARPSISYFKEPRRLTVNLLCDALADMVTRGENPAIPRTLAFYTAFAPHEQLSTGARKKLLSSLHLLLPSGATAVAFARRYALAEVYLVHFNIEAHARQRRTVALDDCVSRDAVVCEWLRPAIEARRSFYGAAEYLGYVLGIVPAAKMEPAIFAPDERALLVAAVIERDDVASVSAMPTLRGCTSALLAHIRRFSPAMVEALVPRASDAVLLDMPWLVTAAAQVPAVHATLPASFDALAATLTGDVPTLVALIVADRMPALSASDVDALTARVDRASTTTATLAAVDAALPASLENASVARFDLIALVYALSSSCAWTLADSSRWTRTRDLVRSLTGDALPDSDAVASAAFFGAAGERVVHLAVQRRAFAFVMAHRAHLLLDAERPHWLMLIPYKQLTSLMDAWCKYISSRAFSCDEMVALAIFSIGFDEPEGVCTRNGGRGHSYVRHLYDTHAERTTIVSALFAHVRAKPAFGPALRAVYTQARHARVRAALSTGSVDAATAFLVQLVTTTNYDETT